MYERTLRRWEGDGRIEAIRTPSGQRRYDIESYTAKSGRDSRKVVAYARVSSRAQQPDLNRLFAALSNLYPQAEIIAKIGGGLNFKRKKLLALLERILSNDVRLVVVAHKDRLARFGFDLFRWLCEQNGCEIVVLSETSLSRDREMVEDILVILHCYRFAEPAQVNPTKADGIIALDPGVRTFLTGFDGRKFLEFGSGDIERITRLCQHLDDLVSRIARESNRKRRRSMRRAAQRMRVKIRDLIDEAHKQIAHYLTHNYRLIFLPTFETSDRVAFGIAKNQI